MISNYIIITIPQWAIFAGITVMIYGWVEKKKIFGIIGSGILVALGLFAAWAVYSGLLIPAELLNPIDPLGDEKMFSPDELPIEGKLLPHYWGLIFNGLLAFFALFGEIFHQKYTNAVKITTGIISIVLFFLMMTVLRA